MSERDNAEDQAQVDDEYEYVEVSEAVKPYKDKALEIIGRYDIVFVCLFIAAACIVVSMLFQGGRLIPTIVIIAVLGIAFAFGLYAAWNEKKKAEHEYEKAKAIYDELQAKMKTQGGKDDEADDDEE